MTCKLYQWKKPSASPKNRYRTCRRLLGTTAPGGPDLVTQEKQGSIKNQEKLESELQYHLKKKRKKKTSEFGPLESFGASENSLKMEMFGIAIWSKWGQNLQTLSLGCPGSLKKIWAKKIPHQFFSVILSFVQAPKQKQGKPNGFLLFFFWNENEAV